MLLQCFLLAIAATIAIIAAISDMRFWAGVWGLVALILAILAFALCRQPFLFRSLVLLSLITNLFAWILLFQKTKTKSSIIYYQQNRT